MKRPRSYGEDLDAIADKGACKDWGRRDHDPDRSSHRRFYPKSENSRKGSTSGYDRSLDDEREVCRTSRKRFDHELDNLDRRLRYRDSGDRQIPLSSPRNIYGDRIHRSESFSASRRDFPKGFRSERDRSRREYGVSAWRRLSCKNPDEDSRFGGDSGRGSRVSSEDRGNNRVGSEDGGITRSPQGSKDVGKSPPWSKDSSSEQTKSVEVKKSGQVQGESTCSSEMEEGEFEPEPDSEPVERINSEDFEGEAECQVESEVNAEKEVKLMDEKLKCDKVDKDSVCDGKPESRELGNVAPMVEDVDKEPNCSDGNVKELDEKEEVEAQGGGEKEKEGIFEEKSMRLRCPQNEMPVGAERSPEHEAEKGGKEETLEEAGISKSSSPLSDKRKELGIDLEVEAEDVALTDSNKEDSYKEVQEQNGTPEVNLKFFTGKLAENSKDKGKSLFVSLLNEGNATEGGGWAARDSLDGRDDPMKGPSSRGFELFLCSNSKPDRTNSGGVNKQKDEKLKMEPLDLSLGLPNVSLALSHDQNQAPNSSSRARSVHSLPSTFLTNSDGFTASVSFSGSQTFIHNPSCSLTQNSIDYEHSVGSHPIFQAVDQVSHGSWLEQSLNEPKRKEVPLYQRMLQNGNGSLHASQSSQGVLNSHVVQGQHYFKVSEGSSGIPNGLDRQSSLSRQLSGQIRHNDVRSPTHSVGSRETRSEHGKDKKRLMRVRNGGGSSKSGQRETEQHVLSGVGVVDRIIAKIVSEPIHIMARRIHEMTDQSIAFLKESICEMIENEDKQSQLCALQEALQQRSDFTMETVTSCPRAQLEILVALKTGLQDFIRRANAIPSSDLVEIFLNMKCRNLACRSILPVDECDCKVCSQKNGFCSACMCIICSKFDMASNTCSWVGCDVCVHWCHTECALRNSYIKNGRGAAGAQGITEMQFFCVACDHPSEMFGFVKEVFKTCAEDWKAETLSKELEYVRRIFQASDDFRGKQLHDVSARMLQKLENKSNLPEVYNCVMSFLTESDSKFIKAPSAFSVQELSQKNQGESSHSMIGPSREALLVRSVSTEKASCIENAGSVLPSMDWDRLGRQSDVPELQMSVKKKPVVDELESIVRIKQAEAKMFQARADAARKEAEALKRIAVAKNEKIEEEYASKITKLRLVEAEERRKQKVEELQVLERAHKEYFNLKIRMEADIKDLLLKMEATKCNLNT